jgi:DNA-damage-inducible protein J
MPKKTANINIRIDPKLKSEVEKLYGSFGLSVTDAINIFLHVSLMEGGLPFEVRQPRYNEETEAAMKEARGIMGGTINAKRYSSVNDMLDDALAEDPAHA